MRRGFVLIALLILSACNLNDGAAPTLEGTPITLKISPAPTKTLIPTMTATNTPAASPTPTASHTPTRTPSPVATEITLAATGTNIPVVTETGTPRPVITIPADTPAPTLTSGAIAIPVIPTTTPADEVVVPAIPTTTDAPEENTTTPETGIVNGRGLRLRALPDAGAAILDYLARNLEVQIIGRSPDNGWLNIITPDGGEGWVMSQFVDIQGDIAAVPEGDTDSIGSSPNSAYQENGTVVALGDGLRLRALPSTNSAIRAILPENSSVQIIGRNATNDWLKVTTLTDGEGWVSTRYIVTDVALVSLELAEDAFVPTPAPLTPPDFAVTNNRISGITATSGRIFQTGQALGNRPNVFSKVGDSITVSTYYLYPFGWGTYNLRDFLYYGAALNYFSGAIARESNSFANRSLAADNGWSTRNILRPSSAPGCLPTESALECEYRLVKPSLALIMVGTNDMPTLNNPGEYQQNLTRIVEISIANGVIPVLFTIPPREDYPAPVGQYNSIITSTARSFDVPLVDFHGAMLQLPRKGLIDDKLHPSIPAQDFAAAVDFTPANLEHGFTIRNLMTLQVLDMLWRQVIAVYD